MVSLIYVCGSVKIFGLSLWPREKQNQFVSLESLAFVASSLCRINPHPLANLFEDFHLHPESRTLPAALNLSAIMILDKQQ